MIMGLIGDILNGFEYPLVELSGQATQERINDLNADIARENLEYQKAFNEQVFQREDTAIQRAKDDAISAGFSPLI